MFDKDVVNYFLENQGQLFDEDVASTPDEAQDFLGNPWEIHAFFFSHVLLKNFFGGCTS